MRRLGLKWVITLGLLAVAMLMMVENARAATCSLYPTGSPPATSNSDRPVGSRFTVTGDGASAIGARFYKADGETSGHTLKLWQGGSELASKATTSETSTGWQSVTFDAPVALTDGLTYKVSVGGISDVLSQNDTADHYTSCGPISPASPFGQYGPTGGGDEEPTNTFADQHYYVDVIVDYETEEPPPDPDPEETVVVLSAGDRERLDLAWWGVWALVGLALLALIAPAMYRLLDVRHGMGGRFERG